METGLFFGTEECMKTKVTDDLIPFSYNVVGDEIAHKE